MVKVLDIDRQGKVKLSRKAALNKKPEVWEFSQLFDMLDASDDMSEAFSLQELVWLTSQNLQKKDLVAVDCNGAIASPALSLNQSIEE
jgi:predicted RNA-binding protein with RPS1 domain